ncbi:MAG: hypothetical protein Q8P05_05835 [Candidatus Diapherotrites archaeon]|nr:hypothetical protein [Candidatus Diapherotrites archaeon]MDZ4256598.1 hypothetical protein [archaeon]
MRKGFIFTIDMVFAALLVILLLVIISTSLNPLPSKLSVSLELEARDAAIAWFYGDPTPNPTIPPNAEYACDVAFRPIVTTNLLNPSDSSSWDSMTRCVVAP